jgi:uncharacterized HAD superfamily protein
MKLLLTDIDGVILNWSDHFRKYLQQYYPDVDLWDPTVFAQQDITADIIKHYNYTAWIGFVPPLRDAQDVLPKFKKDGWEIIACTSMGSDQYANALRRMNIENLFPSVFSRIDIIPFMEPKNKWLTQYRGSGAVWVEDKWTNAMAGADMGLKTFLMRHEYNSKYNSKNINEVDNWIQIYNKVSK